MTDTLWELPVDSSPRMRVPARVFADAELLQAIRSDRSLEQLRNVRAGRWIVRRDSDAGPLSEQACASGRAPGAWPGRDDTGG